MSTTRTTARRSARRLAPLAGAACLVAAAPGARATVELITNDTYVDSYNFTTGTTTTNNSRTNYGNSAVVKAVTSPGSNDFPFASSIVHSVFTLPQAFWNDIGSSNVTSAVVTYAVKTNGLTTTDGTRGVLLQPLLQAFVAGTGGTSTDTRSGTSNIPTPIGADDVTYDGTNAWTTPGGTYDTADSVIDTSKLIDKTTYFSWDITSFINTPALRADLQSDGLLMRVDNDTVFPSTSGGQQFASFYSGNTTLAAPAAGDPVLPTVTFTAVPEPASAAVLAVAAGSLAVGRRRNV